MKKTYIMPEALTAVLGTCRMMATSGDPNGDVTIGEGSVDAGNVGTKEITDVNIWDEEW